MTDEAFRKVKQSNGALKQAMLKAGVGVRIPSAVDALIEETLGPRAALLGKRGPKRPSRKSADPVERAEADAAPRSRHARTLAPIAQMLGCEGFNEHAAMSVLHFARTRLWGTGEAIDERREALQASVKECTPEQRKVIGQFIHVTTSASFQAGMRIGLMASLWGLGLASDAKDVVARGGIEPPTFGL